MGFVPGGIAAIFRSIEIPSPPLKLESYARLATFIFGLILGVIFIISLAKKGYLHLSAMRMLLARMFGRPERKPLDFA